MNVQTPRTPIGPQPWDVVRTKLDQSLPFANMRDTPYYRDAVYEQFSAKEYARALRRAARQDAGAQARRGDRRRRSEPLELRRRHVVADRALEWHALCCYVLVPLDGEPTMIYSMGGTHAEAVRRACRCRGQGRAPQPQRQICRGDGRAAERAEARARPHRPDGDRSRATTITCRSTSTTRCASSLPDAELVFTKNFLHDLVVIH